MTDARGGTGANLRLARQARGFSQQQLASVAKVSRQALPAVAAGLAGAGVASEPAARAYGLAFVPLAEERFRLVIPAGHTASREVQALLKVLASPWLLAQLANLPGYGAADCGTRIA